MSLDVLVGTKFLQIMTSVEMIAFMAEMLSHNLTGVFYCGKPVLAKELKKLSHEMTYKTTTRFEFHKEQF